jgi:hypothetical protein
LDVKVELRVLFRGVATFAAQLADISFWLFEETPIARS